MFDWKRYSDKIKEMITLALDYETRDGKNITEDTLQALQRICNNTHAQEDLDRFMGFPELFGAWAGVRTILPSLPGYSVEMHTQLHHWLRCLIFRESLNFLARHQYTHHQDALIDWVENTRTQLAEEYRTLPATRNASWLSALDWTITRTIGVFIAASTTYFWQQGGFEDEYSAVTGFRHQQTNDALNLIVLTGMPATLAATASLCCIKYYNSPKNIVVPPLELSQEAQPYLRK